MTAAPAPPGQLAIRIEGLVKRSGVDRGEMHGFLGPSGAGKSMTIRVLLGSLRANAGSAELLGGDSWRDVVGLHPRDVI